VAKIAPVSEEPAIKAHPASRRASANLKNTVIIVKKKFAHSNYLRIVILWLY
jgi:hypothetical protein